MDNIKTAKDLMQAFATQNIKASNIRRQKIIKRQRLSPDSLYKFCPYCVANAKRMYGAGWQSRIRPMMQVLKKLAIQISETECKIDYDTKLECDVCNRVIDYDDYQKFYFGNKDYVIKSRIIDLTKVDIDDPNFDF